MQTYRFAPDTKEYLFAEEAFLDPLETEQQGRAVYLLPADSTFTAPLDAKEGYAVCWNGTAWEYVEDHRQKRDGGGVPIEGTGTAYWLPEDTWMSSARYMKGLGPLPEGAVTVKPEKSLEELKADKVIQIDSETSAAILAGFEYTIDGTSYHFSYDIFDQQNFSDTANMCQLALAGTPGLPSSVVWNSYLLDGTLVQQTFDAQSFLALYTAGAMQHKATQMTIGGQRKAKVWAAQTKEEIEAI